MITPTFFKSLIEEIKNYPEYTGHKKDEYIKKVMKPIDAYIFLAYKYIMTNDIPNKDELYEVFINLSRKHETIYSQWKDYLSDNPDNNNISIEEYINKVFIKNKDPEINCKNLRESYTGNDGYNIPYASVFILGMILIHLKNEE